MHYGRGVPLRVGAQGRPQPPSQEQRADFRKARAREDPEEAIENPESDQGHEAAQDRVKHQGRGKRITRAEGKNKQGRTTKPHAAPPTGAGRYSKGSEDNPTPAPEEGPQRDLGTQAEPEKEFIA